MTTSDHSPEALRALLEEARGLRAQLDALLDRLAPVPELSPDVARVRAQLDALLTRLEIRATPPSAKPADPHLGVASPAARPAPAAPAAAPVPQPRAQSKVTGPLVLVAGAADKGQLLNPLGVSPEGRPLLEIDAAASAGLAKNKFSAESKDQILAYKAKRQARRAHLGVTADIDPAVLEQTRWGVVINAFEDAALIKAIWPLIEHRMRQMNQSPPAVSFKDGENAMAWVARHTDGGKLNPKDHWGQVPPVFIYRPGERSSQFLGRYNVAPGPVNPRLGMPYYLLIVGRPGPLDEDDQAFISMNVQYLLDIFWGVGRLCFTDISGAHRLADYAAYVEKLVNFELAADARDRLRKEITYFSTKHDSDIATIRSTNELVLPLTRWHKAADNTPAKLGYEMRSFIEEEATKDALGRVLNIGGGDKPPAVLFTAGHGMGMPVSDASLPMHQGALVTQNWSGIGPVKREHWLAGEDLGAAKLDGMFAFLFACYGVGCPDLDEFIFDPSLGPEEGRPRVASFPLIAQLPQRMLVNGALGVLGHVDRAWTFSFSGIEDNVTGQSQPFEDVLGRLLKGKRAGEATDAFNTIQGERAMALTEELENIKFGKLVEDLEIAKLWMARNDARNYALLGDPAARLPFDPPAA